MKQLFFELLRVAIGTQDKLSRIPEEREWLSMFDIAKKQRLLGICFAGVQKICDRNRGYYAGMTKKLYFAWLGMAVAIQQRNQVLDEQCAELKRKLSEDGFEAIILKGRDAARLYGDISLLRESGDIDVWVWASGDCYLKHSEKVVRTIKHLSSAAECEHILYHSVSWKIYADTEVGIHFVPTWFYSPILNRRLNRWFESVAVEKMKGDFSSLKFNMVYIPLHIYRHLFGEGIGLRQVVDYFFLLRANAVSESGCSAPEILKLLKDFGAGKFVGALMYIMRDVLGLSEDILLCEPDTEEGAFLLDEIMKAGDMGHYDKRISHRRKGLHGLFWMHVKRNLRFLTHYPCEVLWCPVWKIWHQLWRKGIESKI